MSENQDDESINLGSETESENDGRFDGPPQQWLKHTAAERALAASLDDLQANDLSLHLYNTHAIKAKLYDSEAINDAQPWQSKEAWFGRNAEKWRPTERWTAWPLSIANVPRPSESFRRPEDDTVDDSVTYGTSDDFRPRLELEEQLLALVLQKAKNQLNTARSSIASADGQEIPILQQSPKESADTNSVEDDRRSQHVDAQSMTIDDGFARRLAGPSIQHIVSKLDDLLVALHKSRAGATRSIRRHLERERDRDTATVEDSTSESEADADRSSPAGAPPSMSKAAETPTPFVKPLHCRDWSEVITAASFAGWNTDTLQSSVRRCGSLFNEHVTLFSQPAPLMSDSTADTIRLKPDKRRSTSKPTPHPDSSFLQCPEEACSRSAPFDSVKRLHEHLRRKHHWTVQQCAERNAAKKQRRLEAKESRHNAHEDESNEILFDYTAARRRTLRPTG